MGKIGACFLAFIISIGGSLHSCASVPVSISEEKIDKIVKSYITSTYNQQEARVESMQDSSVSIDTGMGVYHEPSILVTYFNEYANEIKTIDFYKANRVRKFGDKYVDPYYDEYKQELAQGNSEDIKSKIMLMIKQETQKYDDCNITIDTSPKDDKYLYCHIELVLKSQGKDENEMKLEFAKSAKIIGNSILEMDYFFNGIKIYLRTPAKRYSLFYSKRINNYSAEELLNSVVVE